jgi:hypothetical protein
VDEGCVGVGIGCGVVVGWVCVVVGALHEVSRERRRMAVKRGWNLLFMRAFFSCVEVLDFSVRV